MVYTNGLILWTIEGSKLMKKEKVVDGQLKKLRRQELLEIILQYAEENQQLQEKIDDLEKELGAKVTYKTQQVELEKTIQQLRGMIVAMKHD